MTARARREPDGGCRSYGTCYRASRRRASEQALPYAEQTLVLGVRRASFLFHKGMIQGALGRSAEARRDLEEALRITPHFSVPDATTARPTLERLSA